MRSNVISNRTQHVTTCSTNTTNVYTNVQARIASKIDTAILNSGDVDEHLDYKQHNGFFQDVLLFSDLVCVVSDDPLVTKICPDIIC